MVEVLHTDFLEHDFKGKRFDLAITNPPFGYQGSISNKFLDKLFLLSDNISAILPIITAKRHLKKTVKLKEVDMKVAARCYAFLLNVNHVRQHRIPYDSNSIIDTPYLDNCGLIFNKKNCEYTLTVDKPGTWIYYLTTTAEYGVTRDIMPLKQIAYNAYKETGLAQHLLLIEGNEDTIDSIIKRTEGMSFKYTGLGASPFKLIQGKVI